MCSGRRDGCGLEMSQDVPGSISQTERRLPFKGIMPQHPDGMPMRRPGSQKPALVAVVPVRQKFVKAKPEKSTKPEDRVRLAYPLLSTLVHYCSPSSSTVQPRRCLANADEAARRVEQVRPRSFGRGGLSKNAVGGHQPRNQSTRGKHTPNTGHLRDAGGYWRSYRTAPRAAVAVVR